MAEEIDRLGPDELVRARLELASLILARPGRDVAAVRDAVTAYSVYAAVTAAVVRRGLTDAAGGLFIGA